MFHQSKMIFCSQEESGNINGSSPILSKSLLSSKDQEIIRKEQNFLKDFIYFSKDIGAVEDDINTLKTSLDRLDKLFSLVVVGEFNSGKSSFLNALLGQKHLEEGITPTTQKINVIRYGPSSYKETENTEVDSIYLPISWLNEINVVDTPGTNAIIQTHQIITEHYIPQSDLVLFITSVERLLVKVKNNFYKKFKVGVRKLS